MITEIIVIHCTLFMHGLGTKYERGYMWTVLVSIADPIADMYEVNPPSLHTFSPCNCAVLLLLKFEK